MERDEMKRLCGINNAARIYSQLQRDYAKVCNYHPPYYTKVCNYHPPHYTKVTITPSLH